MIKIFTINFILAISTAIGMTLLPIIATDSLGISLVILGLIEGSAELLSNVLKLVSGNLFDRLKNKKYLFITPVFLSFLSKITLFLFVSKYSMLSSKLLERISNGLFASPRDAYVAKNALNKGFAFSMLSCSKTLGCVIGTLIISLSTVFIGKIHDTVIYLAMFAAFLTLLALICSFFIESDITVKEEKFNLSCFKLAFKKLLPIYILAFVFFLARFNDGILMLFLKSKNFPEWFYLSTISVFNFVMFFISPVFGVLLKEREVENKYINTKKAVLYITIIALGLFNLCFLNIDLSPWVLACLGLAMWGVQRAGAAIIFSYFIAQQAKKKFIGTAIGVLALTNAVGTFIASMFSGYLTTYSFENAFVFTGVMSFLALLLSMYFVNKKKILV